MKAARFSILVVLSAILIATTNTFAQDYTTLRLPEGAKARLGKGKINEVKYSPSGATEPERRKEDIITDGIVNIQDLVWVASNFGQSGSNAADVNRDGIVNIQDLVLVADTLD